MNFIPAEGLKLRQTPGSSSPGCSPRRSPSSTPPDGSPTISPEQSPTASDDEFDPSNFDSDFEFDYYDVDNTGDDDYFDDDPEEDWLDYYGEGSSPRGKRRGNVERGRRRNVEEDDLSLRIDAKSQLAHLGLIDDHVLADPVHPVVDPHINGPVLQFNA